MTQIDIDHILLIEEIRQLLEAAEQVGTVRASDLAEVAETYELTELEQDAVLRELDQRSIEIVEQAPVSETVVALTAPVETTTDALQLFLREAGRHQLLTAAQEGATAAMAAVYLAQIRAIADSSRCSSSMPIR